MQRRLVAVPSAPWVLVGMVRANDGPWERPYGHLCFCHRKSMGASRGEGWQAAQRAAEMGCWHRAHVCGTQAAVPSHTVTSLLSGHEGVPHTGAGRAGLVLMFAASPRVEDGCGGCRAGFPSSGVPIPVAPHGDDRQF